MSSNLAESSRSLPGWGAFWTSLGVGATVGAGIALFRLDAGGFLLWAASVFGGVGVLSLGIGQLAGRFAASAMKPVGPGAATAGGVAATILVVAAISAVTLHAIPVTQPGPMIAVYSAVAGILAVLSFRWSSRGPQA